MVVGRVRQVVVLCSVNTRYQILLGQTCEWSLWRSGRFLEVVFETGSTVIFKRTVDNLIFIMLHF